MEDKVRARESFQGASSHAQKDGTLSMEAILHMAQSGISCPAVMRKCGRRGLEKVKRSYPIAKEGPLFPSSKNAKRFHWNKDVIGSKLRTMRTSFVADFEEPCLTDRRNRSHSGRRNMISWMASGNCPEFVGMTYASIDNAKVYKGCIDVDPETVVAEIAKLDRKRPMVAPAGGSPKRGRNSNKN